jgi:hypothetical protein
MTATLPPLPAGYVRDVQRAARTAPVRPAAPPVPLSGVLREARQART